MRVFNNLLGIVSLAFFIGGCSSEKSGDEPHIGGALRVEVATEKQQPLSDSVAIQIKSTDGKIMYSYAKLSELPISELLLNPGDYTIIGTHTNKPLPWFDRPSYDGVSSVNVSAGQPTNGKLILKQVNFAVKISYSDKFRSEFTNYTTTISSPDGSLTFQKDETRSGFFTKGPLEIKLTYTDKQGAVKSKTQKVEAQSSEISQGSTLNIQFLHPDEENGGSYEGYYLNATGKTGFELKKALTTIISSGYQPKSYNDLWTAYKIGDIRSDGTGAIWDVYSDIPNGKAPYLYQPGQDQCGSYSGEGNCYNREHVIPKSWFNEDTPMYSDYLHILPTDGYVNGRRSNYPYGEVGSATWTSRNGSKLGSAKSTLGYSGTVFEPIDDFKGDIARIYFYFVTRYADRLKSYDVNNGSTEEIFNANDLGLDKWAIDMLVRWSKNDPVSPKEIARNNEAQRFQNNRNPFVDHPEFVEMIWGSSSSGNSPRATIKVHYIKTK